MVPYSALQLYMPQIYLKLMYQNHLGICSTARNAAEVSSIVMYCGSLADTWVQLKYDHDIRSLGTRNHAIFEMCLSALGGCDHVSLGYWYRCIEVEKMAGTAVTDPEDFHGLQRASNTARVGNAPQTTNPMALGTHILRLLGPKTILSGAFGLF